MARKGQNICGMQFGKLLALTESPVRSTDGRIQWVCRCECGMDTVVPKNKLLSGHTKSCGCLAIEKATQRILDGVCTSKRHGMSGSTEYHIWENMLARCERPTAQGYKYYGGRGILVCDSWHIFDNFYADMGPRPENLTLDRIDVNGNYEKSNCRWATMVEQAGNKRPSEECRNGHNYAASGYSLRRGTRQCRVCATNRKLRAMKNA